MKVGVLMLAGPRHYHEGIVEDPFLGNGTPIATVSTNCSTTGTTAEATRRVNLAFARNEAAVAVFRPIWC